MKELNISTSPSSIFKLGEVMAKDFNKSIWNLNIIDFGHKYSIDFSFKEDNDNWSIDLEKKPEANSLGDYLYELKCERIVRLLSHEQIANVQYFSKMLYMVVADWNKMLDKNKKYKL